MSAGKTMTRPTVCKECGKAYEAATKDAPCPRCALIDAKLAEPARHDTPVVGVPHVVPWRERPPYMNHADEVPPVVVIPGPSSPLSNTLAQTSPPPRAEDFGIGEGLERFMVPREQPAIARAPLADTMACPRCAETIKRAARMCRFCDLDLMAPVERDEPPSRPRRRGSVEVERAPRRLRFGGGRAAFGPQCYCGAIMSETIPGWAVVLAVCFFPLGLLFLMVKETRCSRCASPSSGMGLVIAVTIAIFFIVLVAVAVVSQQSAHHY